MADQPLLSCCSWFRWRFTTSSAASAACSRTVCEVGPNSRANSSAMTLTCPACSAGSSSSGSAGSIGGPTLTTVILEQRHQPPPPELYQRTPLAAEPKIRGQHPGMEDVFRVGRDRL